LTHDVTALEMNTASCQMETVATAATCQPLSSTGAVYRQRAVAPLSKLTVGLIHTYKHINEVQ